ncbi:MAG: glycosyl hydrolase [Kiritimatiellaeota bacterium]|nr:glycosyl hydrolase [Kiritimatiellota bacterium]
MKKLVWLWAVLLGGAALGADELAQQFLSPPPAARPWVYWFPLSGNLSSNGITADLEAMARVGIGGVLYMETDQGTPKGPADFGGPLWRGLIKHATTEAHRLGLEINMNNDAGWCGSGGPWITPALSMQKVVWSETEVTGPQHFESTLPQPKATLDYYRDIALFAYPTPAEHFSIPQLSGKSSATRAEIAARADYPTLSPQAVVPRDKVLDLTAKLGADGKLAWDVPAGKWTLLRLGHTTTGKDNHPAPEPGRGLESDKLSTVATKVHFDGLMQKLIDDDGPLAGKTLVATHIDSWETHSQNWTPNFREDFQRLRGYDPLPLLPVMAGRVVDSLEISERFLWDVRLTVHELLMQNYTTCMRELAHKHGLRLSIEAYGDGPYDNLAYGGQADEPMAEFWSWTKFGAANSCTEMSSAAHVYGKKILGAEAFTATDKEKWQGHPANIKDLGDWAFCEGINRFVFHRYAAQPWLNCAPGISMGPWGLHYERTQTWWEQSKAWHAYLARCQYLLQQGLFVADLCFMEPEGSPLGFRSPVKGSHDRPGYNFDGCPTDVVLTRMSVKDGRLVLPDGMSYRMLVLPQVEVMSPQLLGKIKALVTAGATVVGAPPVKAPGLVNFPQSDDAVKKLVAELWGDGAAPAEPVERKIGAGKIIWGGAFRTPKSEPQELKTVANLAGAKWIWFNEGKPAQSAPPGHRYFRRVFTLNGPVQAATLTMTVDNVFECWINGKRACDSQEYKNATVANVAKLLKPGQNIIAVLTENLSDTPNPAGLIGTLKIGRGKQQQIIASDSQWEVSQHIAADWKTSTAAAKNWSAALELGPLGMQPWGDITEPQPGANGGDPIPNIANVIPLLERVGVPPDFAFASTDPTAGLRYIHKAIGDTDVYFVANKNQNDAEAVCSFRVTGKQPEIWRPDTGRMEPAACCASVGGVTQLPLRFEPSGSLFIVFRPGAPACDPAVAFTRNSTPVSAQDAGGKIEIQQATYGVPGDAAQTRDVKAKVQALVDAGTFSFKVSKLAEGDDPAYGTVKTVTLAYTSNGKALTATGTDNDLLKLAHNLVTQPAAAELHVGNGGALVIEATQPGRYEIKTAGGKALAANVDQIPPAFEFSGAWEVSFEPGRGAPAAAKFDKLISWSEHSDPGVQYFSGHATYRKRFEFNREISKAVTRVYLDLGHVAVMAEVKLNGKDLGILWKPPFSVDVTDAVKAGENTLEVKVVNLWINRLIGDEQLPEDSDRNKNGTLKSWPQSILDEKPSPTGRFTFTSHRLWKKADPLVESGLLGPVTLRAAVVVEAK